MLLGKVTQAVCCQTGSTGKTCWIVTVMGKLHRMIISKLYDLIMTRENDVCFLYLFHYSGMKPVMRYWGIHKDSKSSQKATQTQWLAVGACEEVIPESLRFPIIPHHPLLKECLQHRCLEVDNYSQK